LLFFIFFIKKKFAVLRKIRPEQENGLFLLYGILQIHLMPNSHKLNDLLTFLKLTVDFLAQRAKIELQGGLFFSQSV